MEKIPVLLSLTSTSHEDDEEKPMRTVTTGEMEIVGTEYRITYTEMMEDENGPASEGKVTLKIQPNRVEMNREGEFGAVMVFCKGQRFEGIYQTPYGNMNIALYTTRLTTDMHPDHGGFTLQYQLDTSGQYANVLDLKLQYRAKVRLRA